MSILATDILRVLAGTFIIFNHAGWVFFVQIGSRNESAGAHFVAFFNQLGKPSVLFFIFLSGLAFSAHKRFAEHFKVKSFYSHRILRILPPYILISLIAELNMTNDSSVILQNLITGESMFHLYFIPLIMICYLLYPLLIKIEFSAKNALIVFLVFFLSHAYVCFRTGYPFFFHWRIDFSELAGNADIPERWWLMWFEYVTASVPVFIAGIWSGKRGIQLKMAPVVPVIVLTLAITLVLADFYLKVYVSSVPTDPAGRIWRIPVLLAAAAWIFTFAALPKADSKPWLRRAARASFLVYLIHPFFIQVAFVLPYSIQIPFVILFSWVSALILQSLALQFKWLGIFLGEGDRLLGPER